MKPFLLKTKRLYFTFDNLEIQSFSTIVIVIILIKICIFSSIHFLFPTPSFVLVRCVF